MKRLSFEKALRKNGFKPEIPHGEGPVVWSHSKRDISFLQGPEGFRMNGLGARPSFVLNEAEMAVQATILDAEARWGVAG